MVPVVLCGVVFSSVMGTVARAMDQMKLIAYASILSALIMGVLAYALIAGMNLGLMGYFYLIS